MFCKNCGNQLQEGAQFCNACGAQQTAPAQNPVNEAAPVTPAYEQPAYEQPVQPTYQQPVQPTYNGEYDGLATGSLIFGILSLAIGGIIGIIFGSIAKSKANEYMMHTGELAGKAKVGHILGKIGFILSIVSIVIYVIYFFIYFVAILGSM